MADIKGIPIVRQRLEAAERQKLTGTALLRRDVELAYRFIRYAMLAAALLILGVFALSEYRS